MTSNCIDEETTSEQAARLNGLYKELNGPASLWSKAAGSYWGCQEALEKLPSGSYRCGYDPGRGFHFTPVTTKTDEVFAIEDSISAKIVEGIKEFWNLKDQYRKYKFLWKRGFLLWGPPGCGKTVTIELVSQEVVNSGGISLFVDNLGAAAGALHLLRQIEPERPVLAILEDLDAMLEQGGSESLLLSLLDGEIQIDNIVFVATTNYPEKLDKRITCRPSRFDEILLMDMPSTGVRQSYLTAKAQGFIKANLEKVVKDTNGYSIALLKELLIAVEILGQDYETVMARLQKMVEVSPSSSSNGNPVGFLKNVA